MMVKRAHTILRWPVGLCAIAAVALGALSNGPRPVSADGAGGSKPEMTDIEGIEDLKAMFTEDNGHPRLILILSPT